METSNPKLSVIIPVFNQEDLVIRAIASCPKDAEIIVIDDCSTDRTARRVQWFLENSPDLNIKLLRNSQNLGVGRTVNIGYDNATGEYIVLLGSDDYFLTGALEKVLALADNNDLVYFNLVTNEDEIYHLKQETKGIYCGSVKLMKRDFIGDTRNPDMRASEDLHFFGQLMAKKPTELFTGIVAKHYNYPRVGSLSYNVRNGIG